MGILHTVPTSWRLNPFFPLQSCLQTNIVSHSTLGSFPHASPAFLSFLFLHTDRMTRMLPRMSTTMVKISTLASAEDTPLEGALRPRSLSFLDEQFDPFASVTSKSIAPQGAAAMLRGLNPRGQFKRESSQCKKWLCNGGSVGTSSGTKTHTHTLTHSSACGAGREPPDSWSFEQQHTLRMQGKLRGGGGVCEVMKEAGGSCFTAVLRLVLLRGAAPYLPGEGSSRSYVPALSCA